MATDTDPRLLHTTEQYTEGNARNIVPPPEERYDAFTAAVEGERAKQDRLEAIERGELPRAQAPRAPRLLRWCDVPEYEGFQYKLFVNFPQRLLVDIQSGDAAKSRKALQTIILEHNGWLDAEGEPYPPADAEDFWEQIPLHLAIRVIQGINAEVRESPLATKPRNS